jgi:hypothetical protein
MTAPLPSGRRPYLPGGKRYDGATRDWSVDADGQIRGVHWVDAGMALSLVDAGSIPSSSTTGNKIREKLPYLGGSDMSATVEAWMMAAQPLARYLAAGYITVPVIRSETQNSRLVYTVTYKNLLDKMPRDGSSLRTLVWYT